MSACIGNCLFLPGSSATILASDYYVSSCTTAVVFEPEPRHNQTERSHTLEDWTSGKFGLREAWGLRMVISCKTWPAASDPSQEEATLIKPETLNFKPQTLITLFALNPKPQTRNPRCRRRRGPAKGRSLPNPLLWFLRYGGGGLPRCGFRDARA